MKFKFRPYTIMLVPQDSGKVFKLTIPFPVVAGILSVAAVLLIFIIYVMFNYFFILTEFKGVDDIQARNRKLGKQLFSYKIRIEEVENSLERLKTLTTKLKIISNIGTSDHGADSELYSDADIIEGIDDFSMSSNAEIDDEFRKMQTKLRDIEYKIAYQEEDLSNVGEYLAEQSALLAATPSIVPVKGWVTSRFGSRLDPFTRRIERHEGLDISTRPGTPIVAPADGVVIFAGSKPGYGLVLTIDHGYGITTVYGHNSKFFVAQGTRVRRGMPISAVGNTGKSTGPHLHYEVKVNGVPVDPRKFILDSPWG
ncbi:MAG: M23 family metallopeptidase [Pseudomonadota bacterium]